MAPQSRAAFEADLARIGYSEPDSYDSDRCTHEAARTYALFVLQHEACHEGARTFGDLRWIVYEGCLPCITALENVVACGGLYRNSSSSQSVLHPCSTRHRRHGARHVDLWHRAPLLIAEPGRHGTVRAGIFELLREWGKAQ